MRTIIVGQRLNALVDMRHINLIEAHGPAERRYVTYVDHGGATLSSAREIIFRF